MRKWTKVSSIRIFLASDEAKRQVERAINIGKDETRTEKRKMLSEFLANGCTTELSNDAEKDMILDTIDKLSPAGCEILVSVNKNLARYVNRRKQEPLDEFELYGYYRKKDATHEYLVSIGLIEQEKVLTNSALFSLTILGERVLKYLGFDIQRIVLLRNHKHFNKSG